MINIFATYISEDTKYFDQLFVSSAIAEKADVGSAVLLQQAVQQTFDRLKKYVEMTKSANNPQRAV